MAADESNKRYEAYRPAIVAGRYRIAEVLRSEGGRDVVAGRDVREDRSVVLKRVRAPDRAEITRLRTVHRVLVGLRNPSVMAGLDLVEGRQDTWLVSARAPGPTLREHLDRLPLDRDSRYEERRRLVGPLLTSLFDGLQALHSAQVAHLDVKPSNVRVGPARRAVLVDVGMGRALREDGDPDQAVSPDAFFRAPELLDGLYVSRMADQWALGAIAYLLLTGRPPLEGRTLGDLERAYESAEIPALREWRPDVPPEIEFAVLRMLRWEPDERFEELKEAREALGPLLRPIPRRPLQPWAVPAPPLVGRDQQTRVFERHLVAMRSGQSAVLKVEDDEGSGKTSLLRRWAELARATGDVEVFEAGCRPGSPDTVLAGWFRPDTDVASHGPVESVPSALAALTRPAVILLDDLDSCRPDAWTVIRKVAEAVVKRSTHHPILMVLAAEQLPETHGRLPENARNALNLFLPPLVEQDLLELLVASDGDPRSVDSVARLVHAASEGRPDDVTGALLDAQRNGELARVGRCWSPRPTLGEADLGAPPPALSELFTHLAELGGAAELDLLLDVGNAEPADLVEALDWAAQNGLLETVQAGGRWWARATPDTEPAPLDSARELHRRVAEWLERNAELDGLTAERIAHHWRRAGAHARAADRFRDAVRALVLRGQTSDARRLLQLARTFEGRA